MRLHRKNTKGQWTGSFSMSEKDIALRYLISEYATNTWASWPLDRKLRLFIAHELGSDWTDETAYTRVIAHVLRLRSKGGVR